MKNMTRTDIQSATHVELIDGTVKKIASKWGIDENGHLAKPSEGGFGVMTDDGESIDMMSAKAYWATDHREVWFIYSPRDESWANIRIATFTKAMNRPHEELLVIHNEIGNRVGVRVWRDIVESEGWFKVRKIEVPAQEEVLAAMMAARLTKETR